MVEVAWQLFKEINSSKTYITYAAYLERKTTWSYFSYLMRARRVQKQLNTTKGIVGFTARLEFLSKKVAQLAVFEDSDSLKDFAHSGQHALCAEETKPSIRWMKNLTWNISGSEIPPKLEDAIDRLQSQK